MVTRRMKKLKRMTTPPIQSSCLISCCTKARSELKLPSRRRSWTWKVQANGNGKAKGFSASSNKREREREGEWKKRDSEEEEPLAEEVFNRLTVRVLVSVVAPMGTGLALMKGYEVAREQAALDLPVWLQFSVLLLTFGSSALGIAYGALSTSWNPDVEGSFLGLEQLETNWLEMWSEQKEDAS